MALTAIISIMFINIKQIYRRLHFAFIAVLIYKSNQYLRLDFGVFQDNLRVISKTTHFSQKSCL